MGATVARNALIGLLVSMVVVLLVAVGFLGRVVTEPEAEGAATIQATPAATDSQATEQLDYDIIGEILSVLEQDFVDPDLIDKEFLFQGAIQGIFDALGDPHSTYIDPNTWAISRSEFSGTFQGIGANVSTQDNFIVIVRPIPGTPAERAGIRAGDLILEVDGESAEGWALDKAVLRIRGPRGSSVELLVRHTDGTEERVTIVRDEIFVASVQTAPPGGVLRDAEGNEVTDIGYIALRSFTQLSPQELEEAVAAAIDRGVIGLIVDVRANPGGLLTQTVEIADMFLDEGLIVIQVNRLGREDTIAARPGKITDLPLVIVQDEFSASGSELLAAALQENGRATVVGSRSFGKGMVNHSRELSNGGAVYVSIARWLTPARNQIEGLGVTPDIEIVLTADDIEERRDIALFRAIDVLRAESS
jgi:carboxyl-terminal processing protease